MIEAWLPAIFAIVIVLGMVAARVWSTLVAQTLPIVCDWAIERGRGDDLRRPHELARRIQDLEDQVQFLEALLERGRDSPAPSEGGAARAEAPS